MPLMPDGTFKLQEFVEYEIEASKRVLKIAERMGKLNHPYALEAANKVKQYQKVIGGIYDK